jgi:hypothetical protein
LYRNGRDPHPHVDADKHTKSHTYSHPITNRGPSCNANTNFNTHKYSASDSNPNSDIYSYSYKYSDTQSYGVCISWYKSYTNPNAYPNPDSDSHNYAASYIYFDTNSDARLDSRRRFVDARRADHDANADIRTYSNSVYHPHRNYTFRIRFRRIIGKYRRVRTNRTESFIGKYFRGPAVNNTRSSACNSVQRNYSVE